MSANARHQAYLDAMNIDVYRHRQADAVDAHSTVGGDAETVADPKVAADWSSLREQVAACERCELFRSRTQTVFGVGSQQADWMFVGEAPGAEEDRRGEPFVGRAGKLLDEILLALGMRREQVFIANILKCRPPNNRDPSRDEAAACREYLDRQIRLVQPGIIVAIGRIAAQHLLDTDAPVGRLRGRVHQLQEPRIPLVVTYHPAYLLRSPAQKGKVWQDLVMARQARLESRQ